MPTIRIDNEVLEKLKSMAEAFVDTPNSVLRRVLLLGEKGNDNKMTNQCNNSNLMPTYSHSRLRFKSKYIEPLKDEDSFRIETKKDGVFVFTKAEFYRVFPKVVKSVSYREDGIYHYPKVPKQALPFKIN